MKGEFNITGVRYLAIEAVGSWQEAKQDCEARNMSLPRFGHVDRYLQMAEKAAEVMGPGATYWLGGTDTLVESNWVWVCELMRLSLLADAVCGVRCAVCGVQCAVCSSVQCAVCGVQCAVCGVQCAVCSVQCAVSSACDTEHTFLKITSLQEHIPAHFSMAPTTQDDGTAIGFTRWDVGYGARGTSFNCMMSFPYNDGTGRFYWHDADCTQTAAFVCTSNCELPELTPCLTTMISGNWSMGQAYI